MKGLATLATALAFCASSFVSAPAHAMTDGEKAALAALLAIGVGIAVAKHGENNHDSNDWDEGRYGKPFSPSAEIVCLPKPRQCFKDGRLSYRWTRKIFGSEHGQGDQVNWRGSFKDTCIDTSTDRHGNLRAKCRNERGRWKSAFLAENDCRSHRAGNRNGRLVCES